MKSIILRRKAPYQSWKHKGESFICRSKLRALNPNVGASLTCRLIIGKGPHTVHIDEHTNWVDRLSINGGPSFEVITLDGLDDFVSENCPIGQISFAIHQYHEKPKAKK